MNLTFALRIISKHRVTKLVISKMHSWLNMGLPRCGQMKYTFWN